MARPVRREVAAVLTAFLVGIPGGVALYWGALDVHTTVPGPAIPSNVTALGSVCNGTDPNVADPTAPHGLIVATPPGPRDATAAPLLATLLHSSVACGALFNVDWSSVDSGIPGPNEYNWSWVHVEISTWAAVGKPVDLVVQAVGYDAGDTYVPAPIMAQVPTMQCTTTAYGPSAVTPVLWNATYVSAYERFVRAFLQEFGSDPGVGYIRVGIGTGGEDFPLLGWLTNSCQPVLARAGYAPQLWLNTTFRLLDLESSLHPKVRLMTALNQFAGGPSWLIQGPDLVAAHAVQDGIGIGNQGFTSGDQNAYARGWPCAGDWCALFDRYAGSVPLELNSAQATDPNGSWPGSLGELLPFAVARHAQCLEIYYVDWRTAYDPTYPAYAAYHTAYANALATAAATLGDPSAPA